MEAIFLNTDFPADTSLKEVMATFFNDYSLDSARVLFFKLFQCWTLKDCTLKDEITNQEVALFFDQLTNLVAAAYFEHQANRASNSSQEGSDHGA